jgi:putative acetyltransferase
MNTITIRKARLEDSSHLPPLFEDAIYGVTSRFYTRDQLNAWAGRSLRFQTVFIETFADRSAWVAENSSGKILAYLNLDNSGHIDFFYARPEASRTTITREMYALLEATAQNQGISRLSTEASEAARRFFEKQSFQIISRQDVIINDVSIHNYVMEKILPGRQTGPGT